MASSKEMTVGKPLTLIFSFTLPLLLGNVLQQTYSLIDAAIVGKFLGINALASVGASTSVVFLILGFCNGCCCGFGIPVAQKFGARDYETMRRYVAVSLQLAVVMSISVALITSLFCSDILRIMQTPENIFKDAYLYLLVTFIGVPCTFFYNLLASIIRALGDSKTPFYFLMFSTVLNVLLDLFCILVLGWGVLGAGVATVVSQGVSAVLCYFYMYRHFPIIQGDKNDRKFRSDIYWGLVFRWDCNSRLQRLEASCCKVRIMRWVQLVWQPLRQRLASRCSSCVRLKVWVLQWLPMSGRIMGQASQSGFGRESSPVPA